MMKTSPETRKLVENKGGKHQIVAGYPSDLPGCSCHSLVASAKQTIRRPAYIECPRDKKGMKKYVIYCSKCKENIAVLWAKDKKLSDWCDLHYISEARIIKDDCYWFGCASVNISPVDLSLGFECFCGNDTRDFRGNQTLGEEKLSAMIKKTEKGRSFGNKDSRFKLKLFRKGMI